jgi:AcrR family transcriptional regulator
MPRVLTETDVADFRERLCEAAERLFAEKGPDAVTMRQLASELGVSPMTPYHYFEDKDDILAAVRTSGFNRFADKLEAARAGAANIRTRGEAVGEAYVAFALENPHSYKLMFDLNQPNIEKYPELIAAGQRARATMTDHVKDSIAAGLFAGDPDMIGMMLWASVHGIVVLQLAGMVPPGRARDIYRALNATIGKGLSPAP